MSNSHFAKTPNISIPRTKMKQSFTHKTSFNFGDLVPIDCFEVLPGDTFNLKLNSLIRMSTPIAPIMDNIECYVHAFFVPMRLVWNHTEEFFGANKTSAGPQTTTYTIPQTSLFVSNNDKPNSVSSYLGKPITAYDAAKSAYGKVSVLKERAYWLIWSEWYRAQQLQNPFILTSGDVGAIGTLDGAAVGLSHLCAKVCKKFDYFTAATLYPQYSSTAVTLPLGSYAPVISNGSNIHFIDSSSKTGFLTADGSAGEAGNGTDIRLTNANQGAVLDGALKFNSSNTGLKADLSQATAATINSIRYAFQVQKYLERSNFGSRFFEMLAVHYGVTSPDARLQRPEYLGGTKFLINIDQVLSTADYAAGTSSKVGQTGAVSVTGNSTHLFNKAFVEPGYVMVLLSTKQDQTYSQGLLREDIKKDRFEIYSPEFANLGDQEILNKEIMLTGDSSDDSVFGYQEHWAEYRYRASRVSGILNPQVTGALDYWTLASDFSSRPALDATFIVENRDNITRALVSGATGPDFIGDFYFDYTAVRPMPAYTIPGLVDHFGTM